MSTRLSVHEVVGEYPRPTLLGDVAAPLRQSPTHVRPPHVAPLASWRCLARLPRGTLYVARRRRITEVVTTVQQTGEVGVATDGSGNGDSVFPAVRLGGRVVPPHPPVQRDTLERTTSDANEGAVASDRVPSP